MNIDDMRQAAIRMGDLTGADAAYTLYYDETNNIRRLHVTPDGFNVADPKCFVLGGIAHHGPPRDLDFTTLRKALNLQPSTEDMKLSHVAKGDFLGVLASPRLGVFLEWLEAGGHYVHYLALDPLYWSTVDIIDSILAVTRHPQLLRDHAILKNDLHVVLRHSPSQLHDLFQRYRYPNVGPEQTHAFIAELLQLLEARWSVLPPFHAQMLKGVLQMGRHLRSLPFLEEEPDHILIDEFSSFYFNRIFMLKNSTHVLDTEPGIVTRLEATPLESNGAALRNFRFVERSHDEPGVQISDVVVGLFGKFFAWTIASDRSEIARARDDLSPTQRRNRDLVSRLLDRALEENIMFAQNAFCLEDQHKSGLFLER
jgi:hypothetical protein